MRPPGPPRHPMFTVGPMRGRTPVPRHRRRDRYRVSTVLGGLVLLLVVVAAGGWVTGAERDANHRFREFVVTGPMGQPVSTGAFEVTLLEVRAAAEVGNGPAAGRDTGGVWVVVLLRAQAGHEPAAIRYAAVRDRQGRSWYATERLEQPLTRYQLQPGIPVAGRLAFEVPRPAATELTLRLAERGPDLTLQTVVEIALPIDEAMVTAGLAEPEPVVLDPPEVVAPDLRPPAAPEPL